MRKSNESRLRKSAALVAAVAIMAAVFSPDAQALALGRVTVQSALGEPLRADIDIPEINADEIATLRAAVASPDAFRAAGLEISPAIANIQVTLQRRADGRYFLRLSSDRPVNDPFVDLILEANWSSGRIVRDFTMLFDPQNSRQTAQPSIAAQVSPVPPTASVPGAPLPRLNTSPSATASPSARGAASPSARAPGTAVRSANAPVPAADAATPRAAAAPATATATAPVSTDGKRVKVQIGDTASKIASAYKPATISLDQMLVALLRGNPDAFISGNINRIKAGAVVEVPNAEQASATTSSEANQTVIVQSRDFNEFRRRLAEGLPTAQVGTADRQASGKLQAQVQEKAPAAVAPDKLTLSKGSLQDKAAEEKIVRDRTALAAATRVAELNKNITDLNRLGTVTNAPTSAPSTTAPAAAGAVRPGVPVTVPTASASAAQATAAGAPASPAVAVTPGVAVTTPATAAVPAAAAVAASATKAMPVIATPPAPAAVPTPAAAVPAPLAAPVVSTAPSTTPAGSAASAPTSVVAPVAAPAPTAASIAVKPVAATRPATPKDTSLVDDLLENPLVPAAAGGLLALLLGFAFYRARQRKKSSQVDSSFLESRLQPDSFFGASGGQRIDTAEGSVTGSSMVYLPSQLDSAGDVDPVAEADVYLAYGRDLQAEEILKEALRTNPQRVTIYAKLLEIYAKRRDAKAFEQIATEAFNLTNGEGPEWEHIAELGQELDPGNSLYRAGGQPGAGIGRAGTMGAAGAAGAAGVAGAMGVASTAFDATQGINVTVPRTLPVADIPPPSGLADLDLDLDLDFSLGDQSSVSSAGQRTPAIDEDATYALPGARPFSEVSNAGFGTAGKTFATTGPVQLSATNTAASEDGLDFDMESLNAAISAPISASATPADVSMIEFDLGALSLDLDAPPAGDAVPRSPAPAASSPDEFQNFALRTAGHSQDALNINEAASDDPLAVKLSLAAEFNAIGDPDGARSLAEEVVAEASGDLKSRAQRFLAEIA